MNVQKLDLDLSPFGDAASCHACAERVLAALREQKGVRSAQLDSSDPARAKVTVVLQPGTLTAEEVRALAATAGGGVLGEIRHLKIPLTGVQHERRARLVEGVFERQRGVVHACINPGLDQLHLEYRSRETSEPKLLEVAEEEKIVAAGGKGDHEHAHGGLFGERTELVFSIACGVLTGVGYASEKFGAPEPLLLSIYVLAYAFGGWFMFREVLTALRARRFEIDFLMLLAAVGAAFIGEWFEGALLLFLFTMGHALEGYAMERARNAIDALAKLVPETALQIDAAGETREVPVAQLARGDNVLVKPNTRIPADGFVREGTSSVDQSPVTGESVPVDKRPVPNASDALANPDALAQEHRLFAGTINGTSALKLVVTKPASESTLARVMQLVADASAEKSQTQQFTERLERIFVPAIVILVFALLFAWVVIDEPVSRSVLRAMAVLVAASPCALAIATPSAVLAGVARAARGGVLIKGGAHLEGLGRIKAMALDKTGTLTQGKPRLLDIVPVDGVGLTELLQVAVAIERHSDHPLAAAVVNRGKEQLDRYGSQALEARDVEAIVGYGVRGDVGGRQVRIGKPGLFDTQGGLSEEVRKLVAALKADGRTVMVVHADGRFLGVLGLMDPPRETARQVLARLRALGVVETVVLTGDNQGVADAVVKELGLSDARGDLLPEDKVSSIKALVRQHRYVAMVGDGVNDAPAMANATVGIAMGAGGSDVALETADVALMADSLDGLPFALELSRTARTIIRQNLWISLGMVVLLVPATLFGFAGVSSAVVLHEGSTLLVVANALRLLAFRDRSRA